MGFKVLTSTKGKFEIFSLIGQFQKEHVSELQKILRTPGRNIVLDLTYLKLADGDSIEFLYRCAAEGIEIKNSPEYILEWISRKGVTKNLERR